MPRRPSAGPPPVAIRLDHLDHPSTVATIADRIGAAGGRIRVLSTVRRVSGQGAVAPLAETELEVEGLDEDALIAALDGLDDIRAVHRTRALDRIFGKRVIVV